MVNVKISLEVSIGIRVGGISVGVERESCGSLDRSEGRAGGKTGVDCNTLWLSLTFVDLADGGDREWSGNGLVAGSRWVKVWGIGIGSGVGKDLSLSFALVDLADGGDREWSGNGLVAGS